jgi:hypothetical protein
VSDAQASLCPPSRQAEQATPRQDHTRHSATHNRTWHIGHVEPEFREQDVGGGTKRFSGAIAVISIYLGFKLVFAAFFPASKRARGLA